MVDCPAPGGPVPPDRLGILCHEVMDANFLVSVLFMVRRDLPVDVLRTQADLEAWIVHATPATRLISFCSGVVVPKAILDVLSKRAFNFHPGSPDYPGKYPAAFALYHGAASFGATLHRMVARVDSGPIVGVVQFPVPPDCAYHWLLTKAHQAALHLFLQSAATLATAPDPFYHLPLLWGTRRCSQKALDAACCLPVDISARDLERRMASFGQVPGAQLHVTIQGRRFELRP